MLKILKKEIEHIYSLPVKLRPLLASFFLYSTAYPIISVFINAYIWRNNSNLSSLVFFRTGQFFVVPLIFLINGLLLKKYKINSLYFFGSLIISISVFLTVFLQTKTLLGYFLIGGLLGMGAGFYWANRNYLTIKETDEQNRSYFFGLLFSYSTIIGLIVTFAVGWLIVFGLSYQLLISVAFVIIALSGSIVLKKTYHTPKIGKLFISQPTSTWQKKRLIHLGIGIVEGLSFFVPSLLILIMVGNEGILGTLTAVSSIFSAVLIYYYGRKSDMSYHKKYFILSVIFNLALSILLALFFQKYIIIFFSLFNGLVISFLWLTVSPLVMKNIDIDSYNRKESRFCYILDSEIFLNIGRVFGCFLCLSITFFAGDLFSLRFSPFILSIIQFFLFLYLEKRIN
jgi:MFS family permease